MSALELIALDTATPQLRAPGTGDTYTAPRAVALTPETLTGSAATSSLSIAQTWNTTGTPTALSVAVTDTASNAASLLLNATVGGTSQAKITKGGFIWTSGGGLYGAATNSINVQVSGTGVAMGSTQVLSWAPSTAYVSTGDVNNVADLKLVRDAANTLALRNSTNAQAFRVSGTHTDASNYRRVELAMTTAGVATLVATGAGTGASGNVLHISSLPTSNPGPGILWNNAGTPAIGT